ncbi:hypothetical protein VUR80DRAFT_2908 [Thermomyces stellatus]
MALPNYNYTHFTTTSPAPFVAHVEINRPTKLNTFTRDMWLEFGALFGRLSHDPDVRAVVLSGAGEKAFCAGLDVKAAAADGQRAADGKDIGRAATALRRYIKDFQGAISKMEECEKPVICVLHGISIGLAIDIACCTDVRFASQDTNFAVKEVDIGLAADIGTLARLPKIVGSTSWVKDVCLTARNFSAEEALGAGFVSRVLGSKAEAVGKAVELASSLAAKSPVAVQGTKEILNHARDHSVQENLRYTAVWNAAMMQSQDFITGLKGAMSKKKPTFEKL